MTNLIPVSEGINAEAVTAIVDTLLLSIISANPDQAKGRTNAKRLNEAKSALFGIKCKRGRSVDDDVHELMFIAEAYADSNGATNQPDGHSNSISFLAKEAIQARRLADGKKKYEEDNIYYIERVHSLQKKFSQNIQTWQSMLHHNIETHETIFSWKLEEFEGVLAPLGVSMKIPDNPLRNVNSAI